MFGRRLVRAGAYPVSEGRRGEPGVGASAQAANLVPRPLRYFAEATIAPAEGEVLFFWRYLLLHLVARGVFALIHNGSLVHLMMTVSMLVAFGFSFSRSRAFVVSKLVALLSMLGKLAVGFPTNSNHFYLELLMVVFFCLSRFRVPEQRSLYFGVGRALIAWVMFFGGVQKILHGTYFNGALFATRLHEPRFAWFFELLCSPEEFARLSRMAENQEVGPYGFGSIPVLLLSNGIYLAELAVGLLLVMPRWRSWGALAGFGVVLGIEVVAREIMFGLLACNLLALSLDYSWQRRIIWCSLVGYVLLLLSQVAMGPLARFFN